MLKTSVYCQHPRNTHFGDAIATISKVDFLGGGIIHDYNPNIKKILDLKIFEIKNKIVLSKLKPNVFLRQTVWDVPLIRSKKQWKHINSKIVCCQFDGVSCSRYKNPSLKDIEFFENNCKNIGLKVIHLGLPLSIQENIDYLVMCDIFVGCDSGMSHLARSCGVPVIITKEKQSDKIIRLCQPKSVVILNNLHKIFSKINNIFNEKNTFNKSSILQSFRKSL